MLKVKLENGVYEVSEKDLLSVIIDNYGYVDQHFDNLEIETIGNKKYLKWQPEVDCIYCGDTATQNSETFIAQALPINDDGTIDPHPVEIVYDYTDDYKSGSIDDMTDACDWDHVSEIRKRQDAMVDWFASDIKEL